MLRPGALKSRLSRTRTQKRPAEKHAPGFLQWLRGRPCLLEGHECEGKIEAAHVDFAGDKGMGTRVSDKYAIPLCGSHHRSQHSLGWQTFMARYRIQPLQVAEAYWRAWPGRAKWEADRA